MAVVVAVHLGLALVPVEFSQAHSDEEPTSEIALTAPPDIETPAEQPEPELEPEVQPEPEPEPEPEPDPRPEEVVEAQEPSHEVPDAEVAVDEEPEPEEPVEEKPRDRRFEIQEDDNLAELDPFDSGSTLDVPSDWEPTPPSSSSESTTEPAVDWDGYARQLMGAVESNKDYPRMAQRRGWEGEAMVRIVVGRDGKLTDRPDIVESTRHTVLDDEVVRMVEAAEPFDGFPAEAEEEQQEFVIPVRFELRG